MKKFGKVIFKTVSYTAQAWFIITSLYTIGKLVHQNQEMSKFLKTTEGELRNLASDLDSVGAAYNETEEEFQKLIDKGTNNYNNGYVDGYAEGYKDGRRDGREEAHDDIYTYLNKLEREDESNDERTDN